MNFPNDFTEIAHDTFIHHSGYSVQWDWVLIWDVYYKGVKVYEGTYSEVQKYFSIVGLNPPTIQN